MTLHQALLFVHLLAMAVGVGGVLSAMIVAAVARGRAPEIILPVQIRLARWGFLALVALWITGGAMLPEGPDTLPGLFWAKMAAVAVLTGAAVALQLAIRTLPPPDLARRAAGLRPVIAAAAISAVALAVLTFG